MRRSVHLENREPRFTKAKRKKAVLEHCWMESLLDLLGIKLLAEL